MRIGIIGLGMMGGGIARHLSKTAFTVVGYDPDPAACEKALIKTLGSAREVIDNSDVVFTVLSSLKAIDDIYFGAEGYADSTFDNLISVDCSTVSPEQSRKIFDIQGTRGITHIELPMIGLGAEASSGNLFFFAAGEEKAVQQISAFLETAGRGYAYVGPPGSAVTAKVLNNSIGAVTTTALAEALAICRRDGVDPEQFIAGVIEGAGAGSSAIVERHGDRMARLSSDGLTNWQIMGKDSEALRHLLQTPEKFPAFGQVLEATQAARSDSQNMSQVAIARLIDARINGQQDT